MKQVYSHSIFAFLLLSCLFFSACEKEQVSGDDFSEEEPPLIGNTTDDITALIIPQQISETFPYSVKREVGKKEIALYPVEGEGEVTLRHSIYPFYAFEKSTSNGDYYLLKSEVAVTNENMYKGYTLQVFEDEDRRLETTTRICGFYLREIRVSYELMDKDGKTVGEFPVGHSPTPLTTIGSTTYTTGFSWSLGAQIRIGNDTLKASPLIWNIAYNNEAKRNIQDMDVRNSSNRANSPVCVYAEQSAIKQYREQVHSQTAASTAFHIHEYLCAGIHLAGTFHKGFPRRRCEIHAASKSRNRLWRLLFANIPLRTWTEL